MRNAPTTRPPTRSDGGRRPAERTPVARDRRLTPQIAHAHLVVAADRFDESGDKDIAETMRILAGPRGWELLKPPPVTSGQRTYGLYMASSVKKRLEDAARAIADKSGKAPLTVLAEVVNEGWQKFLDGEFEPVKPVRAPRGKAPAKENLNVRPNNELRVRVEEAAKAASEELGWEITPGKVAMSYLFDEFGISDEDQLK